MNLLVIDIGTSGLRAAIVDGDAQVRSVHYRSLPPDTPFAGLVEFDALALADTALNAAHEAMGTCPDGVDAVGISNQRASTVVWDRATGLPVGPALGWQDLRTVMQCIEAKAVHGLPLAPNQSATKLAWLLDTYDADRARDLCFGTVDTWLTWFLTEGRCHVTDRSNAAVTGLVTDDASSWSSAALDALRIPAGMLPTLVDTSGTIGEASRLVGSPPITALVGDQQASLIGQSCVTPGTTKITFGTGGMLDTCGDATRPVHAARSENGTFPIVAWGIEGRVTWATEAIMLSAGTNVEWLVDDLGVLADAAASDAVAAQCADTDGVVFVPALMGLGTPHWDYGARGTLLGVTRGTGRPQLVRAVLEGVAHRGADLIEATERDLGIDIAEVRIDGGMSRNATFVEALANASGRVVEVAQHTESTTLGAAYLAGLAIGAWTLSDIATMWTPQRRVEPTAPLDRDRWHRAVERSERWIPELSALDF